MKFTTCPFHFLKETVFYLCPNLVLETLAGLSLILNTLKSGVGEEDWKDYIVCTTDPEKGVWKVGEEL